MFKYELAKNMSLGKTGDCTRLILRDSNGDVIFVAFELTDNHYILGKKGDEGFDKLVQSLKLARIENE